MIDRDLLPAPTRIKVDGTEIATYVIEPTDGRTSGDVVLCHGTPWSAASLVPLARTLAARYRVFLWDMPGYGASIGDGAGNVDLETQWQRLAAVLRHWRLERPHVLAHDIGGAVALGAHLLGGVEYASLYLLDIVTLEPWGSPFFRLVREYEHVFQALPLNLHGALVREYIAGAGGRSLDPAWVDELARPWCTPHGIDAFSRQIAQLRPEHTEPIAARLGQVRCPVRVGWGDEDPWIPPAQAAELAARLPGPVDVTMFSGAGHLVPLEATEELSRDVLAWLNSAPAADLR
jgi:pimeloyl-ACP methyl ester carboxylesterase